MTINLKIRGNGDTVAACQINGESADQPVIALTAGTHEIEIQLQ